MNSDRASDGWTVSIEAPVGRLVTSFADSMPRWRPEDVNGGADAIVRCWSAHGVPVTMHEPTVFLSVPLDASVEAGGETYRAKPPSNAPSVPEGVEAELGLSAGQSQEPALLLEERRRICSAVGQPRSMRCKAQARVASILITQGFGNPALDRAWPRNGVPWA